MPGSKVQASDKKHRFKRVLAHIKYLNALSPTIQDELARSAQERHFRKGQIIYMEGEPATALYFIETGWVKSVRVSSDGREQAMLCLCAGEIFGEAGVLTRSPYPCTVIALEDTVVWRVGAEDLHRIMARHHAFAMAMSKWLSERIRYYIDLVEDLSLCGVEARVARTLLRHAQFVQGRWVVLRRAWSTFDEMAVRLGTVRDVLSRSLRALEKEGVIKVHRQEIEILDPERLRRRGRL